MLSGLLTAEWGEPADLLGTEALKPPWNACPEWPEKLPRNVARWAQAGSATPTKTSATAVRRFMKTYYNCLHIAGWRQRNRQIPPLRIKNKTGR